MKKGELFDGTGIMGVMQKNGKAMTLYLPITEDELAMLGELYIVSNDGYHETFTKGSEQERWLKGL